MSEVMAQLGQALGALFLGGVGLWFAHSYRRQLKVKLADRLFDAYANLWEITQAAPWDAPEFSREERKAVARAMGDWYYKHGHGLLMPPPTRKLFVILKENLEAEVTDVKPRILRDNLRRLSEDESELALACACIRYFSLFRTQLKNDLAIYSGHSKHRSIRRKDERQLLKECGLLQRSWEWRKPPKGACICGCVGVRYSEEVRQRLISIKQDGVLKSRVTISNK